ncbi:cytosine deaminase protein [Zopfochytrium polystomum]|nr:cytosine deaminase protein [Zopfochytrium polystomum]
MAQPRGGGGEPEVGLTIVRRVRLPSEEAKVGLIQPLARPREHGDDGGARLFDVSFAAGKIAAISQSVGFDPPSHFPVEQGTTTTTTTGEAVQVQDRSELDGEGLFAFPGFADVHLHLDKACILDRCVIRHGTLAEAVAETSRAKASFSEEDVYQRAKRTLLRAIANGTTLVRTFAEVDPRVGLRSLRALVRLREELAFAVKLQICAFAQEGTTNEPATLDLLDEALREGGADLVGGCPYTDPDPARHVAQIFDLAQRHNVDVDFHIDFDLDPSHTDLPAVLRETRARGYAGRVAVGHATNLSAMPPSRVDAVARDLADAGVALIVLPATDLFLTARDRDHLVPRGVAPAHRLAAAGVVVAAATNNVLNPFTPFGDASLLRVANLFANVAQLAADDDLDLCFRMVSALPARIIAGGFAAASAAAAAAPAVTVGAPANLVLLECRDAPSAVREIARVVRAVVDGVQTLENGRTRIFFPSGR